MSNNPSGWYPDPSGRPQQRWWDGNTWTDFVSVNGQTFVDSPAAAPAPPQPQFQAQPQFQQVAAAPAGAPAAGTRSLTTRLAAIAAVALAVGGAVGYVARGDGDGGSSGGGGAASGSLSSPLIQGMSSLDSYEYRLSMSNVGPTSADRTDMSSTGAADKAAGLRHQTMSNTSTSADDPQGSTSNSESWMSADLTCTFDGEEYTSDSPSPIGTDFGSIMSGVFDIVIPDSGAQKVGDETVAGVAAEHYSFSIQGLGADSGWLVDANQGDVWVAKDGGYVLKYTVNVSMRSDAQSTESYTVQLTLELTSVNQPVTIQVPGQCPVPGTVTS